MNHSFIFFLVMFINSIHGQSTVGLNPAYSGGYDIKYVKNTKGQFKRNIRSGIKDVRSPNIYSTNKLGVKNQAPISDESSFLTQSIVNPNYEWVVDYLPFIGFIDLGIRTYSFSPNFTQINGKFYHQLTYNTSYNSTKVGSNEFYREENNTVFKLNGNNEIVLYDFNLIVGDSINYAPLMSLSNLAVTQIDSVRYKDNLYRKRFKLNCLGEEQDFYWIEGIGSFPFIFNSSSCTILDVAKLRLRCFYENGIQVFQDSLIQDCLISGVEDNHSLKVRISPNPSYGMIYIDNLISPASVLIYNMAGIEILRFEHVLNQINIGELNQGLYILEVRQGKNIERHRIVRID